MKKLVVVLILMMSSFGFAQDWKYNFEEAKTEAQSESKNIVIIFSGSRLVCAVHEIRAKYLEF